MRHLYVIILFFLFLGCGFLFPLTGWAQATISTGSIEGTIIDPSGAVVPGAKIRISSKANGQGFDLVSSGSGTYSSGNLIPADYEVKVVAPGFKTVVFPVTVQVGVVTSGNATLEVGTSATVITVGSTALGVNTEQATIQGVTTTQQIEQLPIDGRNFLDLAQLEPGVQIQDGANIDSTKSGYLGISLGGRNGRTTRIEVDGIDISDETVGTTTQNIPASAIQEFQISQSSLDLSTELTSSGAVSVVTRSGSNTFHGESFLYARGNHYAARYGTTDHPFDREQYGARLGGPLLKNRLFFFADWERTVQDLFAPVELSAPFTQYNGGFNAPFHATELMGRLDWQIKPNWRAFYRWTYDQDNSTVVYLPNTFEPFANRDNTPVQAAGLDVTQGSMSHSIRFGYTRFHNTVDDAVSGTNITNLYPGADVHIGWEVSCTGGGFAFCSGASMLAPQITIQHNLQFKYDGTKSHGAHIIRFGVGVNRILGLPFGSFFGIDPAMLSTFSAANRDYAATGHFPGGESNPLNYPVSQIRFGNGQGYNTEIPQFGYPAGGEADTRFAWYLGDTWKLRRNFTVLFGLRYVRDTGRTDSDIASTPPLNLFAPGLGARVHQPNLNFAPQIGLAWDPWKSGKTVIRAGAGVYFENSLFGTIMFDRAPRLAKGLFWNYVDPCPSGALLMPDTGQVVDTSAMCNMRIGDAAPLAIPLFHAYQASVKAAGAQANPGYIGTVLQDQYIMFGPDYRTPRSYQFNVGVQRQIKSGTVLSVDYIRNVGVHYLHGYDTNHVGDARYLNLDAATNAINATNRRYGCGSGLAGIDCAIAAGARIFDYAGNGLDSGIAYLGGSPASYYGKDPATGAAFPGINPNVGTNDMLFPIGRSLYNALQFSLRTNKAAPFRGSKNLALQISYALSRFDSMARDQDFLNNSYDYRNNNHYFGPNALDRTHQLAFGGVIDFPHAFRLAFTTQIKSALPANLTLPAQGSGDIFIDDLTGDGTVASILPGTNVGSFGRDVKVNQLNSKIDAYNRSVAGKPTPAGQALINAGLFRADQLASLGGIAESLADAPRGQVGMDSLLNTNLRFGWVLRPKHVWNSLCETFSIEPQVSIFNLFNFANYDGPGSRMNGELNGGAGSVNGTTQALRTNRIGLGSGVFALGAPRTLEFGVRVSF